MRFFSKSAVICATALLCFSIDSNAACSNFTCNGVTNVIMDSVQADTDELYINFPEGTDETLECNLVDKTKAVLPRAIKNYNSMQSMLLSAVTSNLPVEITFDLNKTQCEVSSIKIKVYE